MACGSENNETLEDMESEEDDEKEVSPDHIEGEQHKLIVIMVDGALHDYVERDMKRLQSFTGLRR